MTVKEMIEKLKAMPPDARLAVEVNAYYYEGSDFEVIDDPEIKNGVVYIGSVDANP